jgi:hypothetical protein
LVWRGNQRQRGEKKDGPFRDLHECAPELILLPSDPPPRRIGCSILQGPTLIFSTVLHRCEGPRRTLEEVCPHSES